MPLGTGALCPCLQFLSRERAARIIGWCGAAQGFEPGTDIGRKQVAYTAIDIVERFGGGNQITRMRIERIGAIGCQRLAQRLFAVCALKQLIGIEPGKRLPLLFEHGNHLPQIAG